MENKNEQDLRLLHLRFIGKILAGFTHEIKNYMAIIKESAGLIEDMIKLEKSTKSDSGQYLEITRSIEEQIEKTNDLFRYLNRFSHRMDTELSTFSVNETLEELSALLTRFANQRKISLEKDFQKDIPSITSNPSMLQFLVFHFLEEKIARLDKNSRLTVKTAFLNNSVEIRIIPEGHFLTIEMGKEKIPHDILNNVIQQLGGIISQGGKEETVIALPSAST
jgi:nitrogen-specific signal transduction histidine kinase